MVINVLLGSGVSRAQVANRFGHSERTNRTDCARLDPTARVHARHLQAAIADDTRTDAEAASLASSEATDESSESE